MLARMLPFAVLLLAIHPATHAQTTASKPKTRAANVVSGTIAALDSAAATVSVQPKTGAAKLFRLTEKTLIWRAKKIAEASEFKAGDPVTVRYRKSAVGPASLYDMADPASWAWVDRLRHETTAVTVKEIDEESLHATEGPDASEFTYRVTDKTQWSKAAKPATPADYKPGDKVHVIPRLLPGGGTMAIAVTDAPNDAAKLKERGKLTVSGTIKALNTAKRTLNLHTAAGDDREITLEAECVIRSSGKDVPLSYLRPGQLVTVHLVRGEGDETTAKQVTIKPKSSKRLPGKATVKKKPA